MSWRERGIWTVLLVALVGWATGCQDAGKESCERATVDGQHYCVASGPIIETGFDCPRSLPHRHHHGDLVICSEDEQMSENLREKIARRYDSEVPRSTTQIAGTAGAGPTGEMSLEKADVTIVNPGEWGDSGESVTSAGDVNGDGYEDLLVGDRECCQGIESLSPSRHSGAGYLIYGEPTPPSEHILGTSEAAFVGKSRDHSVHMGNALAGIGDVNGDGFDDIAVSAVGERVAGTDKTGKVYIFFGKWAKYSGEIKPSEADAVIEAAGSGATKEFGRPVDGADIDGDGYSDLIIGDWIHHRDNSGGGRIWVFYGGKSALSGTMPATASDGQLTYSDDDILFARRITNAGDVDGDGHEDVLVGGDGKDRDGKAPSVGKAFVLWGGQKPTGTQPISSLSTVITDGEDRTIARYLAGGADIDSDGFDDLLIAAPGNDVIRDYVVFGRKNRFGGSGDSFDLENARFVGTRSDGFQYPGDVAVGDINGDGFGDIAPATGTASSGNKGRIFLIYGGANQLSGQKKLKTASDAQFVGQPTVGHRADTAGAGMTALDINGDGYDDLAIGAPAADGSDGGRVYIIFGG